MTADVAVVAPYPPAADSHHAGSSGVASYSANLVRAVRDAGSTVDVIAPSDPNAPATETDGPGINVRRCFSRDRAGLRKATDAALETGAPVVHLQFELFLYGGPGALGGLLPLLTTLRRNGRRTVVTLHQAVAPETVDARYTRMHRVPVPATLARAAIAGVQRSIAAVASATIVHEEPFRSLVPGSVVVPHGIEPTPLGDRTAARARLGLDDRLVALCFGFLAPYKGLERALEAADAAGPSVRCVVAGGEHPRLADAGDPYARDLQQRHPGATFTGWVPGGDVADWFQAADVALFPYPRPFSSSGALALALAAGTPVLLSTPMARCIGAPSAVTAASTDDLADRLRRLADDPAARDDLRRWSRTLAVGRGWSDVARHHQRVYAGVAA